MIRLSIGNKIMGIAVTLIALMVITAVWTVVLVMQVGDRIEEFDATATCPPMATWRAPISVRSSRG